MWFILYLTWNECGEEEEEGKKVTRGHGSREELWVYIHIYIRKHLAFTQTYIFMSTFVNAGRFETKAKIWVLRENSEYMNMKGMIKLSTVLYAFKDGLQ